MTKEKEPGSLPHKAMGIDLVLECTGFFQSVEAGVTHGWERFVGQDGLTIGLDRFGASGPAEVLFKHFGFSAEAIVPKILSKLGK